MSKKATKTKAAVPSHAPKPVVEKPAPKLVKPKTKPVAEKKTAVPLHAPLTSAEKAKKLAKNSLYGKVSPESMLPADPVVGEGRIWDGAKWVKVNPTALSEIVMWQNAAIKRQASALKFIGDETHLTVSTLTQLAPQLGDVTARLQNARIKVQRFLDGEIDA